MNHRTARQPITAVLFRHSYIWRLGDSLNNLDFQDRLLNIEFVHHWGGSIRRMSGDRSLYNYLPEVRHLHPDIIYLHVGEDDLEVFRSVSNFLPQWKTWLIALSTLADHVSWFWAR